MHPRQYSLEALKETLIHDDGQFNHLSEQDKDEIAAYSLEHMDEFFNCVEHLLYLYDLIRLKSSIMEHENKLITLCRGLLDEFDLFQIKVNSSFEEINKSINQTHDMLLVHAHEESMQDNAAHQDDIVEIAKQKVNQSYVELERARNDGDEELVNEKELAHAQALVKLQAANDVASKAQEKVRMARAAALNVDTGSVEEGYEAATIQQIIGDVTSETSVYTSTKFELSLIQENMKSQLVSFTPTYQLYLKSLALQSEGMLSLIENIGIEKIQRRLEFCFNIFINLPYKNTNQTKDKLYSTFANALAQFWYDEGVSLTQGSELAVSVHDEVDNDVDMQSIKNHMCLVFYFMSNPNMPNEAEKMCYRQLLRDKLKVNVDSRLLENDKVNMLCLENLSSFTLLKFARELPSDYIHLFDYLFMQDHAFSKYINELLRDQHINVRFNTALFKLYASIAHQKLAENGLDNDSEHSLISKMFKEAAKNELLSCFDNGIDDAKVFMDQHYSGDLKACIELAIMSESKNDPSSHIRGLGIFHRIKHLDEVKMNELDDDVLLLLEYWLLGKKDSTEQKEFALRWLKHYANQKHKLAINILIELARNNADYVETIGRVAITLRDKDILNEVLTMLMNHQDKGDDGVIYYQYLVIRALTKEIAYVLLCEAADRNNEYAKSEVTFFCNSHDLEIKQNVYLALLPHLKSKSSFASALFNEAHMDFLTTLIVSKCRKLSKDESDRLATSFFRILMRNDESSNALATVMKERALANCRFSLSVLTKHAQYDWKMVVFLMDCWLPKQPVDTLFNHTTLLELRKIFNLQYNQGSPERCYYLYVLERDCCHNMPMHLLDYACVEGVGLAIHEVDKFINHPEKLREMPYYAILLRAFSYPHCIGLLTKIAELPGAGRYFAAEALCVYYMRQRMHEKASIYFNYCLSTGVEKSKPLERLKYEGYYPDFVRECSELVLERVSEVLPKEHVNQRRTPAMVMFWEENIQRNSNQSSNPSSSASQGMRKK